MTTQVRFGDFVLDVDSRELRRSGTPLKLSPKALQPLEILATSSPKAFSKAELQDRLWPGTFVVEKNLANLVAEIRETLGDNAADQRFIRTVPRFGYAFREQRPATPAVAEVLPATISASKPRPTAAVVAAGFLCVVAAIAGVSWVASQSPPPAGTIRLAVLPLENLTGDPDQDYLCDGMTEELIGQLGAADPSALKVIARTSAMHYRNTTKRADEIGRELGVQYLLETSLRRVDSRVRISVRLVSTETQNDVWSEQYDHHFSDPLILQRKVADEVARRTADALGVSAKTAGTIRPPDNAVAYEQYLRGRHHLQKDTRDGLHKARTHFQNAVALDPRFARAYSGLAEAYLGLGEYALMPISESHPLARDAAVQAIRLDDSLADAHRALAAVTGHHYWQWEDAVRSFERAIQLAPNDVTTLRVYSFYLAYTGRPVHALPIADLPPVSIRSRFRLA